MGAIKGIAEAIGEELLDRWLDVTVRDVGGVLTVCGGQGRVATPASR